MSVGHLLTGSLTHPPVHTFLLTYLFCDSAIHYPSLPSSACVHVSTVSRSAAQRRSRSPDDHKRRTRLLCTFRRVFGAQLPAGSAAARHLRGGRLAVPAVRPQLDAHALLGERRGALGHALHLRFVVVDPLAQRDVGKRRSLPPSTSSCARVSGEVGDAWAPEPALWVVSAIGPGRRRSGRPRCPVRRRFRHVSSALPGDCDSAAHQKDCLEIWAAQARFS